MLKKKIDALRIFAISTSFILLALSFMTVTFWYDNYQSEFKQYVAEPRQTMPAAFDEKSDEVQSVTTDTIEAQFTAVKDIVEHVIDLENEVSDLYCIDRVMTDEEIERVKTINVELLRLFNDRAFTDAWYYRSYDLSDIKWQGDVALNYETDTIHVIFTLKLDDGTVLACVFTDYDIANNMFVNSHKYMTMNGLKNTSYTPSDEPESETSADTEEFLNTINDIVNSVDIPPYEGEITTRTGAIIDE